MKNIFSDILNKPYLWLTIIALIAVISNYYLGINYSYDSNWYMIFANRVGENLDFDRMAVYAPLYSFSLGFLILFGVNTITSILIYWWFAYLTILIVFYKITKSAIFSIIGFLTVFSNFTTANLLRYVWTELGYSVILLIAILSLYKYFKSNGKFKIIFLISIALLPLQRYIGGYISLYLGLIFLFYNNKNIVRRGIELSLTSIPIILVILWNLILSGHFSGYRDAAKAGVRDNINGVISVLYDYFSPEWFLYLIVLLITTILIKRKKLSLFLFYIFLVPLVQIGALIISNSMYKLTFMTPRYFIPLTPIIILLFMIFIKEAFNKREYLYKLSFSILFFILFFGNLISQKNSQLGIQDISKDKFTKVKDYLSAIPEKSVVGIYVKNSKHLQAELILTSRIIPKNHCKNYMAIGNFRNEGISYAPNCKNSISHMYIPFDSDSKIRPKYLLLSKDKPEKGWKEITKNYSIQDLGSFLGLTRLD